MSRAEDKIIQYLAEAQAMELALVTTLRAHIILTPRGAYRLLLERHLDETRTQARRIGERLGELGASRNLVASGLVTLQTVAGQAVSLSKGPIDALRGRSGEEKLLKNAKDECATEALEIATYLGLETLARSLGDEATAALAVDHRAQEERMLARLHEQIPRLTEAVVAAELGGERAYDRAKTGAADAARSAAGDARAAAEDAGERARGAAGAAADRAARAARGAAGAAVSAARRVPGADRVESGVREALGGEGEVPLAGYDTLRASDILTRLPELSQAQLEQVEAYERAGKARKTVLARIDSLRGEEPWPGYDDQDAEEIERRLADTDPETAARVRDYERRHRARPAVMAATGRMAPAS